MRMRTALMWASLVQAAIAGLACFALVALTTLMHSRVTDLTQSMQSFRRVSDIESALLLHRFTTDPTIRIAEAATIQEEVERDEKPGSPGEARQLEKLRRDVMKYLEAASPAAESASFTLSLSSAHRLALEHFDSAELARRRAARMDALANVLGVSMALMLALCVSAFLWWLWRQAFAPVSGLQNAMARFATGDLNARAPEDGSSEFRAMAHTFNTTAAGLQRARHDRLSYAGAVLHDLRTPLSAIQLATQFVSNDQPFPGERRIRELFTLIRRQLTRLNGIVGDSLGVLRAESGDLELRLDDSEACKLAEECVELFRSMAPHHLIDLECPEEPIRFRCDVQRVEQLLNNLLSNAVKYSQPGCRIRVEVSTTDNHDEVRFVVADEGRGIAPEDQERIFKPFQRAVSAHEEIPGVGLGLYVSRSVAEAHGGTLDVQSELGKGSTFRVAFPIAAADRVTSHSRLTRVGGEREPDARHSTG